MATSNKPDINEQTVAAAAGGLGRVFTDRPQSAF